TPVSLRPDIKSFDKRRISRLRLRKHITLAGMLLVLGLIAYINLRPDAADERPVIVVAGKNYTEQTLLGHIFSELIEARTRFRVDRKLDLGGTNIVFAAIQAGEVDMYVEYTGTAYAATLGYTESRTAEETHKIMIDEFRKRFDLETFAPLGFNNTYVMMVTPETAEKYGLKTLSDLALVSPELICGPTMEFMNRWDGLIGLTETYKMRFKNVLGFDGGTPRYAAIINDQTQVSSGYSTDGTLIRFNMVLLEDDKRFFPPYHAVPVIRAKTLERYPQLREVVNSLAGKLDDDKMRHLNYLVEVEGRNARMVAREFLREGGFID
ncbi:MAG: ABC transporter permease, partial [Planctomycetes bacterium]|nr:ABC transporter permease [Planctomycetota bacterium]